MTTGRKIAGGVAWMMLFRGAERLLGLISTLILVRLLLPADFGVVAMAMSVIAAVEVFGAFGFDTALIQRRDATRAHYDTAWTFNVIVALGIATLLALLAVPAAGFYREPRLDTVILLLALGSLVGGLENIGVVDFRKQLEFDKEFRLLLAKKLVGFCLVIPLAFILRSFWALVISTVVSKVAGVLITYVAHPYRPRFTLAARKDLMSYSKWLFFNNWIVLVRDRSADLVVGRLVGSHGLGLYTISNEVSTLPQQFVAPVNRAVFPGYASQSASMDELRRSFLNVTSLMWTLAIPAGIGISLVAPVLVPVVLGSNWLDAVPIIGILALSGTLMVMEGNVAYVFYALGVPRVMTFLMLAYVVLLLPLLVFLTRSLGVTGAAYAHLATSIVLVPVSFAVVFRYLGLPLREFAKAVWRILVAAGAMAAAVPALLDATVERGWAPAASLVAAVLAGACVYCGAMAVLWLAAGRPPGVERIILGFLRERLPGARGATRTAAAPPRE